MIFFINIIYMIIDFIMFVNQIKYIVQSEILIDESKDRAIEKE